jgi:hypothetical protein
MMSDDQSAIYSSLRASTAVLLGYDDVERLTAAQEIRLSRAISLRLICDAAQAAQLCGRPYDVRAFTDASESLERLVGGNPDAPEARRFSGEHQARLRRLIEKTVLTPSATEHEDIAARQWREEQQALAAASDNWTWQSAPVGSQLAAASSPAAERSSAGGDGSSASPPAAPAAPPQPPLSDVESMRQTNENAAAVLQRSGYLKRDEPWMDVWKRSPWSFL